MVELETCHLQLKAKLQLKTTSCFPGYVHWAVRPAAYPGETRDAQTDWVLETSHIHDDTSPVTTLHNTTALPAHRANQAGMGWGQTAQNVYFWNTITKLVSRDFSIYISGSCWLTFCASVPSATPMVAPALCLGSVGRCWTPAVPCWCTAWLCWWAPEWPDRYIWDRAFSA